MPNEIKNNVEGAPLGVSKGSVKNPWKVFKRSIYSSLNVKVKKLPDEDEQKESTCNGENSLKDLVDSKLRFEPAIAVDTVDNDVQTFLGDSNDCDDIGELLDKYRYELNAFNRVKGKLDNGDLVSEFSELSSISELSSGTEDDTDDTETIISRSISTDLQNRLTIPPRDSLSPHIESFNNGSLSNSSSTLSASNSPNHPNDAANLQYNFSDNKDFPPPERATAVLKPLPSIKKAYFVPELSPVHNGACSNGSLEGLQEATSSLDVIAENSTQGILERVSYSEDNFTELVKVKDAHITKLRTTRKRSETSPDSSDSCSDQIRFKYGRNKLNEVVNGNRKLYAEKTFLKQEFSPTCPSTSLKPLNISQSTMEKYPYIFANYLPFQDNPFNSLPNLTGQSDLSQKLSTHSVDNPTIGRSYSHSTVKSVDLNAKECIEYLAETAVNEDDVLRNISPDEMNVIDENYFVIYPESNQSKLTCGNPTCTKQHAMSSEGSDSLKYTSCPACNICYCSRSCRHSHWPEHKETCVVGFVNFYVHTFFRRCEKDIYVNTYLRKLAHTAYQIFGRGCLTMTFKSPNDIEYDAVSPGTELSTQPTYKDFKTVLAENKPYRHLHMLCQNIKDYDPDQEFVLDIFVYIGNMSSCEKGKLSEKNHTSIVRSARISVVKLLNPDYGEAILSYGIRTFSLPTSFQGENETDVETRRYYCKEIAFGLKRYGVHLKSEYPVAYEKLYRYIDKEVLFSPIILYGKRNNRNYKCILYSGELKKSQEYCGAGAFV